MLSNGSTKLHSASKEVQLKALGSWQKNIKTPQIAVSVQSYIKLPTEMIGELVAQTIGYDQLPYLLMAGGYDGRQSLYLLKLEAEHKCHVMAKLRLLDERGEALEGAIVSARGDKIYVSDGMRIYVVAVAQALLIFTA